MPSCAVSARRNLPSWSADGCGSILAQPQPHLPGDGCGPTRRKDFAAAVVGQELYIIGGWDGYDVLGTVERYDPAEKKWTLLPPMWTPRCSHAVAVLDDKLYVIGGHDGHKELDSVEQFDPVTNEWYRGPSLRLPRAKAAATACDGLLYTLGGCVRVAGAVQYLTSVECLDVDGGTWVPVASMRVARSGLAAVEADGALYVLGGYDGIRVLRTCERLVPGEGARWEVVPRMMEARNELGAATLDGCIFVVGGDNGNHAVDSMESFDMEGRRWLPQPSMGVARSGLVLVELAGELVVIGGHSNPSYRDSAQRYDFAVGAWCALPPMRTKSHGLSEGELPAEGGGPGRVWLSRDHIPSEPPGRGVGGQQCAITLGSE